MPQKAYLSYQALIADMDKKPHYFCKTPRCRSALLDAVREQNEERVKNLLTKPQGWRELHYSQYIKINPLLEAIQKENIKIVNIIASHPKFLAGSFKDNKGNTPFHYIDKVTNATTREQLAAALIANGMRIDLTDDTARKPAHYSEYLKIQQDLAKQQQAKEQEWFNRLVKAANNLMQPKYHLSFLLASVSVAGVGLFFNSLVVLAALPIMAGTWYACHVLSGKKAPDMHQLQSEQLERDFINRLKRGKLTATNLNNYLKQELDINHLHTTEKLTSQYALKFRDVTMMKLLLSKGLQISPMEFCMAMHKGHYDLIELYINKLPASFFNTPDIFNPLINAILNKKDSVLEMILTKKGLELQRDLRKDAHAVGISGGKIRASAKEYHLLDFAKAYGSKASVKLLERALKPCKPPAVTPGFKAKSARRESIRNHQPVANKINPSRRMVASHS